MDYNLCYSHTSDVRAIHSRVAGLPEGTPLKKMDFPSPQKLSRDQGSSAMGEAS